MIRLRSLVPDKSISHRAALISALSTRESRIENFSAADDCVRTVAALRSLGRKMNLSNGTLIVESTKTVDFQPPSAPIDLGNSGTGIRLLMGVLAGFPVRFELTGDESLQTRPMDRVAVPLRAMGARIDGRGDRCLAPLLVEGRRPLAAIKWKLDPASAQVKSAILLATLFADGETEIEEPVQTRDHTERMFSAAGADIRKTGTRIQMKGRADLKGLAFRIPEDFSAAAFFIALGIISKDIGGIELLNVGLNPTRIAFLDAVREMGANITIQDQTDAGGEPSGRVVVRPGTIRGTEIPLNSVPNLIDEIPILSILAMSARGKTVVRGAKELRVKESDRIKSIVRMIEQFGGTIREFDDGFDVTSDGKFPGKLQNSLFTTFADHRIAMSALIAGKAWNLPVTVDNRDCINTSFPGFFDCLGEIDAQSHSH